MKPKSDNKEVRIIWDELAYISRYMQSINPKLEKYKELDTQKKQLQKRLKEIKKIK